MFLNIKRGSINRNHIMMKVAVMKMMRSRRVVVLILNGFLANNRNPAIKKG